MSKAAASAIGTVKRWRVARTSTVCRVVRRPVGDIRSHASNRQSLCWKDPMGAVVAPRGNTPLISDLRSYVLRRSGHQSLRYIRPRIGPDEAGTCNTKGILASSFSNTLLQIYRICPGLLYSSDFAYTQKSLNSAPKTSHSTQRPSFSTLAIPPSRAHCP